jgi:hypothetical protein
VKAEGVDEVTAIDAELRVIDRALGTLQRDGANGGSTAPAPIQFVSPACASYQIRQIEFEQVVPQLHPDRAL